MWSTSWWSIQFSAMAKEAYKGDPTGKQLTAFLGNFYGLWLNLVTFVLQLFLTSFVASRFGVGGTLQIMPVTFSSRRSSRTFRRDVLSTAGARLAEAATRYPSIAPAWNALPSIAGRNCVTG